MFIAALISLAEFNASRLPFSLLQGSSLPLLTHVSPLLLKVSTAWLQKLQQLLLTGEFFIAPMLPLVVKNVIARYKSKNASSASLKNRKRTDRNSNKNVWVAKKQTILNYKIYMMLHIPDLYMWNIHDNHSCV